MRVSSGGGSSGARSSIRVAAELPPHAPSIGVNLCDHCGDLGLVRLKAQRTHGHLELLGVDGARAVGVKKVKGLTDL